MVQTTAPATLNLGFLTVLHEHNGYSGGYLVTNRWGRPLEFRLSTAVQPNRIHQILYAGTLLPYICADLIGKTLVDKTGTAVQSVFTNRESVLNLRSHLEVPVVWLAPPADRGRVTGWESVSADPDMPDPLPFSHAPTLPRSHAVLCVRPATDGQGAVLCHPGFPADVAAVQELLDRLDGSLDLTEPFTRIREAMSEARKIGATSRG